jgi:hypothetical protein
MKVLLRDYLASLREREELDAILPDLLSELGFTVFSRPQRGTAQRGVDIGAVGLDDDGERKVFLFSVKQGDLTRQDWDGSAQSLRSSLNEIRDVYIRNRLPAKYRDLKVVICLAFGGDVQEQVREQLVGYIRENTTERISFEEWNGDKLAGLLLKGILREELLPKDMRSSFQKAVSMVDEPDIAFLHFARLARALRRAGSRSFKARVRAGRQLNICLWILFVWARDAGNLEAAYRASELAVLTAWELLRPTIGSKSKEHRALTQVLLQLINLHLTIATELLEGKVFPHAGIRHGLSLSIGAQSALNVNLALFETLGRIGLAGLWIHWLGARGGEDVAAAAQTGVNKYTEAGLALIANNPALHLPITDRQSVQLALFLQLWLESERPGYEVAAWLGDMANRLTFTVRTQGRYPCVFSDYRDLAEHPRHRTEEYFQEATAGSSLIPLMAAWLNALGQRVAVEGLERLVREKLAHCNLQLWMPDSASEDELYVGEEGHGRALSDLSLVDGSQALIDTIWEACRLDKAFDALSAIKTGYWPIVLLACRHHGLPVPPQFWIRSIAPGATGEEAADATAAAS